MLKPGTLFIYFVLLIIFPSNTIKAQINTYSIQGFDFGTFYQGSNGGTIDISTEGLRTASGDIILMNTWQPSSQAIFEITAPAGSTISVLRGTDSILTGSNGGTLTLQLQQTDLGSPFSTTAVAPARTRIKVAGKLIIGNRTSSPPGKYQGTVSITFNQE